MTVLSLCLRQALWSLGCSSSLCLVPSSLLTQKCNETQSWSLRCPLTGSAGQGWPRWLAARTPRPSLPLRLPRDAQEPRTLTSWICPSIWPPFLVRMQCPPTAHRRAFWPGVFSVSTSCQADEWGPPRPRSLPTSSPFPVPWLCSGPSPVFPGQWHCFLLWSLSSHLLKLP